LDWAFSFSVLVPASGRSGGGFCPAAGAGDGAGFDALAPLNLVSLTVPGGQICANSLLPLAFTHSNIWPAAAPDINIAAQAVSSRIIVAPSSFSTPASPARHVHESLFQVSECRAFRQ
jgi:hypothetical protein